MNQAVKTNKRVIDTLKRIADQHLQQLIDAFLQLAGDEIFKLATNSSSTQEQQRLYDAAGQLASYQSLIRRRFLQRVLEQFDRCDGISTMLDWRQGSNEGNKSLAVVDKHEFEDWLTVKGTIDAVGKRYHNIIDYINQRLSVLIGVEVIDDASPYGITYLCHAFQDAITEMDLHGILLSSCYRSFELACNNHLEPFYTETNNVLKAENILPELEKQGPRKKFRKAERQEVAQEAQARPDALPGMLEQLNFQSQSGAGGLSVKQAAQLFSTIRSLFEMRRRNLPHAGNSGGSAAPEDAIPLQDVVAVLNALQSRQRSGSAMSGVTSLRGQLTSAIKQNGIDGHLDDNVSDRIELTESLFESILQHSGVIDEAKPLLRKLQIPFLKLIVMDESFMLDPQHPARKLLNQLTLMCSFNDISAKAIEKKLENFVNRIGENYQEDQSIFETVLEDVNKYVGNQQTAHTRNAQRVAKSCEGQEERHRAQLLVRQNLAKRLLGVKVPSVTLKLLESGLRDIMVLNLIKEGRESESFRENLAIIDQLQIWLGAEGDRQYARAEDYPLDRRIEARTFITGLETLLEKNFPGQFHHVPVLKELNELLSQRQLDKGDIKYVTLDKNDELYGFAKPHAVSARVPDKASGEYRWVDRVQKMEVGMWLTNIESKDRSEDLRLAWVSDDKSRFVFVDRQGQKKAELNLNELIERMKLGWKISEQDADWSPVDKSMYSMLQKVYDELDYQRCHDELTGLYNRKEFENILDGFLFRAKRDGSEHCLAYINLDQFRVINDYCGVVAGDQLLQEISTLMKENLNSEYVMARMGGNEFAVLFDGCSENEGMELSKKLLIALREYRFDWQNHVYRLTASIGLSMMNQHTDNVVEVFKNLSSASILAKEQGRNRIVSSHSEEAQAHKRDDVLSWVSRINSALEHNRLKLRCQLIKPLSAKENGLHYEILLGVQEEDCEVLVPPDKFIAAAERYNRMQEVDRWVVRHTLTWMKEHVDDCSNIAMLSINLSGNSINDDSFLDFLTEQFKGTQGLAQKVCFEVTETATISNLSKASEFIYQVKKMGCLFALDDFGTGMSSYEYLKHLPVDFLKIDGCFIKDIVDSTFDFAVVRSINEIGHFMGKKTIAEYVENEDILALLNEIGVDYAQGFGVEKPGLLQNL